jgi:hypothetical protein
MGFGFPAIGALFTGDKTITKEPKPIAIFANQRGQHAPESTQGGQYGPEFSCPMLITEGSTSAGMSEVAENNNPLTRPKFLPN